MGDGRVVPVVMTGDEGVDSAAIRNAASGGGVDLAFDMVGQATSPNSTLAALLSLKRRGRMVLMGSMTVPLPLPYGAMLRNGWELIGHFMYASADYRALVAMVRAGQLSLDAIHVKRFPFDAIEQAIDAAGTLAGLEAAVVTFHTTETQRDGGFRHDKPGGGWPAAFSPFTRQATRYVNCTNPEGSCGSIPGPDRRRAAAPEQRPPGADQHGTVVTTRSAINPSRRNDCTTCPPST
jgi:hypothetical protein